MRQVVVALCRGSVFRYHSSMRCRQCDYLLFNLTHPGCPECGRPFSIEEYRFEPAAVSFHCPHCDQPYYGNDDRGLPVPRAFTCVTCQNEIALDELRVVPERDDAMGFIGSTWDNRQQHGLWSAWWATFKQLLLHPSSFYREHAGKSIREAWLFSMIASYLGMVPAMAVQILLMWGLFSGLSFAVPGAAPLPPGLLAMMVIVYGLVALVAPLIMMFIGAGFYALTIQLALLCLVPHRKPIDATFRVGMYSFGAYALSAVPICGSYVCGIWQLVIMIVGIKEVHQTTGWRAAIAVLWPVVVVLVLYAFFIMILLAGALENI